MFTVFSPENPQYPALEVSRLNLAIEMKHARQSIHTNCNFVIEDSNGYVVSTKEQSTYLIGVL